MLYLAQSGTQNPLVPNLTEVITGLIAFFIVFGVLGKVLLPRIQQTLQERTDAIEGGLHRAEEAQAEAARLLDQYKAQLAEARHEASRLREQAKEEGAQIKAELRARGRSRESSAWWSPRGPRSTPTGSRRSPRCAPRSAALSVELASRIVGESLQDEARQRRTVDRFLDELEEQAAEVRSAR